MCYLVWIIFLPFGQLELVFTIQLKLMKDFPKGIVVGEKFNILSCIDDQGSTVYHIDFWGPGGSMS